MPEVFSRNTRHERWHNTQHLSLLCIATHMPFAQYLRQEPLMYFSKADPCQENIYLWQYFGTGIWLMSKIFRV